VITPSRRSSWAALTGCLTTSTVEKGMTMIGGVHVGLVDPCRQ